MSRPAAWPVTCEALPMRGLRVAAFTVAASLLGPTWGCSSALQDPLRAVVLDGDILVASCDDGDLLASVTIQRGDAEVWSARVVGQGLSLRTPIEVQDLLSSPDYHVAGRVPPEVGAGDVVTIRSSLGNYTAFEIRDSDEGRGKLGDVANLNW